MIDFQEAYRIAQECYGPESVVAQVIEKPYGWVFHATSKRYLETGDIRDLLYGGAGVLIERADGRAIFFGSTNPTEEWLANYEKGLLGRTFDLTITAVHDLRETLRLLEKLRITYVLPEEEHGVIWRIPTHLSHRQLKALLADLPITFPEIGFAFREELLHEFQSTRASRLTLEEHVPGESTCARWLERCAAVHWLK